MITRAGTDGVGGPEGPQLSNLTLREQMKLTDSEIAFRKQILGLTDEDARLLKEFSEYIDMQIGGLVSRFYEKQTAIREIEILIGDADTLERLQASMKMYVRSLFEGDYGVEYVSSRLRIGLVHKRIGVPPKLYLCGIQTLSEILSAAVEDYCEIAELPEVAGPLQRAVSRLIRFDVGLVFDTYIRSLTTEVEMGRDMMERHAEDLEQVIAERTRELEKLAKFDALTGLFNQRSFHEHIAREVAAATRYNGSVSLIYFDLDGFKNLNDSQGHSAGDAILKLVGQIVEFNPRETDFGCRYGGDEFCVILPRTTAIDSVVMAERIVKDFKQKDADSGVTLSLGIAEANGDNMLGADALVKAADAAMYKAKKTKGYKVEIASVKPATALKKKAATKKATKAAE